MIPLSLAIREYLASQFPPDEVAFIEQQLAEAVLPFLDGPSKDRDRVHGAIIFLSNGDRAEFLKHLSVAKNDWRDTLVAAAF